MKKSYFFFLALLFVNVFIVLGCATPKTTKITTKETIMYPVNEPYVVTAREVRQNEKYALAKSSSEIQISYFATNTTWKLSSSLEKLPLLEAPNAPLLAALYTMALEEALKNIRLDGTFMAGEKWTGVWTRDISYSIHLALAILFPEISEKSLFAKVDTNRAFIIQDTGTGGSWPISTDRVVWSLAARELLSWHPRKELLTRAYEVMKNTALADRHAAYDVTTGLYRGESSFMDWREQSYASWMGPVDIYQSFSFSTCVLHYAHLTSLFQMATQLGYTSEAKQWAAWASSLRTAIRTNFYEPTLGTYASYIYPFPLYQRALKTDNLGLALAVLTGVVDRAEVASVVQNIPVVPFGVVCLWPQQPHAGYYHNKGIWPFVNAYYVLAAHEAQNVEAVTFGIKAMTRAAALLGTHKENFSYDRGHTDKMAVNSDRQLWSVAGYLGVIYKVVFGMRIHEKGLSFQPIVPDFVVGPLTLRRFPYRSSLLDISIEGTGDTIDALFINGVLSPSSAVIDGSEPHYTVVIRMKKALPSQSIRLVSVEDISLPEPKAKLSNTVLTWNPVKNAISYTVFLNGKAISQTREAIFSLPGEGGVLTVQAMKENVLSSCLGAPVWVIPPEKRIIVEMETVETLQAFATNRYKGFSGEGYVLLDNEGKVSPVCEVVIPKAGKYLIRFRYANGNGPINTDNRCGLRTFFIDGKEVGVIVFPQRGTWTEWGYSSHLVVRLTKGKHVFSLQKTPLDENMNGKVNQAALDTLELILWE